MQEDIVTIPEFETSVRSGPYMRGVKGVTMPRQVLQGEWLNIHQHILQDHAPGVFSEGLEPSYQVDILAKS